MTEDPFDVLDDGAVVLRLHVQPGAGRTTMVGRHGEALKVRVAAPPEGGRANAACLSLVAATLGVAESQVELVSGPSSRAKRVRITGVAPDDVRRLLASAVSRPVEGTARGGRAGRGGR